MRGERVNSLESKDALRMTFEDPDIAMFILKHFTRPEQYPVITTRMTWKNGRSGYHWIVEILEMNRFRKTMNAVIASVDSSQGRIRKKRCLSGLFHEEYLRIVKPLFFYQLP